MSNLIVIKPRFILSIYLIFIVFYSKAQINTDFVVNDSSNLFFYHWKKNIDSVNASWIATKPIKISIKASNKSLVDNSDLIQLGLLNTTDATVIYNYFVANQSNFKASIALFNLHKKVFEQALIEKNLPVSLASLTFAMTAMNKNSRNFMGGAGFWQLTYAQARRGGLNIESYFDERLDVYKSSQAAAAYLQTLYAIYKDWKLVIAAYSCGATNLNKTIRRNNDNTDFYSIKSSLPAGGRDVVDALTATILFFSTLNETFLLDYSPQTDTIEVNKRLHFSQLHYFLNIDLEEIRYLNPIYKQDIVPAVRRVFHIILPKGSLSIFNQFEDSIYVFNESTYFNLPQKIDYSIAVSDVATENKEVSPPVEDLKTIYYVIKSGDNLGKIAGMYNVKISELQQWNNISNPGRIQVGQKIKVKVSGNQASQIARTNSSTSTSTKSEEYIVHTVKSGESAYSISLKYPGVTADDILRWNNISDPSKIQVGQKLKIKK